MVSVLSFMSQEERVLLLLSERKGQNVHNLQRKERDHGTKRHLLEPPWSTRAPLVLLPRRKNSTQRPQRKVLLLAPAEITRLRFLVCCPTVFACISSPYCFVGAPLVGALA